MAILVFKTLHIIGFTAWFAGLFYLVRIFVYHTEAYDLSDPEKSIMRKQYNLMESRVYKIIMNPAMMLTWTCGLIMIYLYGWEWYKANIWLHFKIGLLILLTIYHLYCKGLIKKLEKGKTGFTSFGFRLFNEVPTLFLATIVILAVFKNMTNALYVTAGIIGLGLTLYLLTKLYKKRRENA